DALPAFEVALELSALVLEVGNHFALQLIDTQQFACLVDLFFGQGVAPNAIRLGLEPSLDGAVELTHMGLALIGELCQRPQAGFLELQRNASFGRYAAQRGWW